MRVRFPALRPFHHLKTVAHHSWSSSSLLGELNLTKLSRWSSLLLADLLIFGLQFHVRHLALFLEPLDRDAPELLLKNFQLLSQTEFALSIVVVLGNLALINSTVVDGHAA